MNIYLIRHAIAEDETADKEDSQRALTDKGAKKMRQIAKGLRKLGVEFDIILSSPYLRAKETAEILGDVFKIKKQIAYTDNLMPTGDPDLLITEINEKYTEDAIALVGHEPYLTRLVSLLSAQAAPLEITLKKGGICRLSADDLHHSRQASIEWLLTPGVLVEVGDK